MDALVMFIGEDGRLAVCDGFEDVYIQMETEGESPVALTMTIQQVAQLRDWLATWVEENKHLMPADNPDDYEDIPF